MLNWVNDHVKSVNPDAYIVGECWDALLTYAQYYASGVDSFFDFAFADSTGIITKTINYCGAENSAQAYAKALVRVQNFIREYGGEEIGMTGSGRDENKRAPMF